MKNFLLHRVSPVRDELWDPMDVVLFEKCISRLVSKYHVVQFEEYMNSGDFKNHENCVSIMFDDGYKDNIEFALPILEKHGVKASFYVVTECIDENIPTWTYILDYLFHYTNISEFSSMRLGLPKDLDVGILPTETERVEYVRKLKPWLKTLSHNQRQIILSGFYSKITDVTIPKMMMSWDDLVALKAKGHFVGSHGVTHAMLGTIQDEQEIKKELLVSGSRIHECLGSFPLTISYPVGSFNDKVKLFSKEAGYMFGLAVKQKDYDPMKDDFFEIPRIELYNESWIKTKLRISGKINQIKKIFFKR